MSKSTWLKLGAFLLLLVIAESAAGQTTWKTVYLRAMSREGKRIYLAVETADLRTIRRFEVSRNARVRLYFAKPPFGNLEQRTVTVKRFVAIFTRKDRKPPQPTTLKGPFLITLQGQKITAIEQRLQ